MLRSLHIRDFVIIDAVDIELDAGFTVFTGETGAGKSILIDALSLALGARADAGALRTGANRAEVSAVFDTLPQAVLAWLREHELDAEDGSLVMRRVIDAQGRSRAFVNGTPSTATQLQELGVALLDIHGQHAHQALMRGHAQRDLLDQQGGHATLAADVELAWRQWQDHQRRLDQALSQASGHDALRDQLQWQLDELDQLNLSEGEWQTLQSEHTRLAHAQALLDGATQALGALDSEEDGVHQRLVAAVQSLSGLLKHDPQALKGIVEEIESARIAVDEAISDLNGYLDRVDLDPQRLAELDARLGAIFNTARKLKAEPQTLAALRDDVATRLAGLAAAADLEALRRAIDTAQTQYLQVATKLGAARKKTARTLSKAVTQAMQTLAMQGGQFEIALHACAPGPHGTEQVEFLVAGHAGTAPRPLAKVASGGELSRISLAISTIASQAALVPTLIFDEVDSGVGGAVAETVGEQLRELGQRHQVLCVTHLPQVAACATAQFLIHKRQAENSTRSEIQRLDEAERIEEIARMLGGLRITATTREHAREMLAR